MKWFRHESNAHDDVKLQRLYIKYGLEGYGLYWYLLELIAQNVDKHNLTFELEHDSEIVAAALNLHYEKIQEMMAYMVKLNLFENVGGIITCLKMAIRTDEYTQKLMRSQDLLPTLSGHTTDNIRVKRKKEEKERKKIGIQKFIKPSLEEIKLYCQERKNHVNPNRFYDFYESKDWYVGKNKMKNWKAAVRTWEQSNRSEQAEIIDAI